MANILVTGGGGYIGSHTAKLLLQAGHSVVALDNFSRGWREPLEIIQKYGDLLIAPADLRKKEEIEEVFKGNKIDAVIHFAALSNVDESVRESKLYFENNVLGTNNLLEAMKKNGVGKIIFSSTCAVYGEAKYLPVDEEHPLAPLSPYGESKREAESLIEKSGLQHVILRYFNVSGADPDGEIGDSRNPQSALIQNAVRGALGIAPFFITSPKVATPDGTPVRDYIDVMDVARAHIQALKYLLEGGKNQILNLGSGKGFSVKEIIKTVQIETGKNFEANMSVTLREGESKEIYADIIKAKNMLGWVPVRTLGESIQSLIKWYKNKPKGYKN